MSMKTAVLLATLLAVPTTQAAAQKEEFFPISEVRPGLTGVGRTVFHGTTVEQFDVEILGVLEKVGPQQNLILARLSGDRVEEFGVFAGMSGSPVYIEGKLLGAVAYAFSFAKAPIAGITPIQEMVDVFTEHQSTSFKLADRRGPEELYEVSLRSSTLAELFSPAVFGLSKPMFRGSGQLEPIQTPLNLTGFSAASVEPLSGALRAMGLVPVFGTGAAGTDVWQDVPLEPGSTVAVQLVRGDLEVSASGTVTHISGDKVYAFGHPFLGVGYTDLPMAKAAVLGVIPSLMNSMKISATTRSVGAITQDRSAGIFGMKDRNPRLIPVRVNLETSRGENRRLSYEITTDPFLSPFLVAFTVNSSIVATERSIGNQTLQVKCRISLKGQPEAVFENSISDMTSSPALAALTAAAPVQFILGSGFEDVSIEGIEVDIASLEKTREAVLEKVWQDSVEAEPGEEVGITVFLRKPNGEIEAEKYPVKIPEGLAPGPLKVLVGDGVTLTRVDSQSEEAKFIPKDLGQLVRAINNLKKNDRLYIRLFREQAGAVIGGEGLPGLPPSLLELYNSRKTTGDVQPIKNVIFVEHELPATDYVIVGQKTIEITIKG